MSTACCLSRRPRLRRSAWSLKMAPLILRDNELVFDEEELLQKVLELAELETAGPT